MCYFLGDSSDPYSLQGYFGTAIDVNLFGDAHLYHGEGIAFDPEGLTSTIPAVVSVVAGFFAGKYIQQKGKGYEMLSKLFLASFALLFAGYCWDMFFPVNKKIWTSSYVLVAAGFAIINLGIFIYAIEFKNYKGAWSRFFDVFGKNPLFIFVLSGFVPRVLGLIRIPAGMKEDGSAHFVSPFFWFYENICKMITFQHERSASVLFSLILLAFYWLIGYLLDKRKIYIKV
jgi:predicted acyltransferase